MQVCVFVKSNPSIQLLLLCFLVYYLCRIKKLINACVCDSPWKGPLLTSIAPGPAKPAGNTLVSLASTCARTAMYRSACLIPEVQCYVSCSATVEMSSPHTSPPQPTDSMVRVVCQALQIYAADGVGATCTNLPLMQHAFTSYLCPA